MNIWIIYSRVNEKINIIKKMNLIEKLLASVY